MSAPSASWSEPARIGPNAVIQLGESLHAHGEALLARAVYAAAGHSPWLTEPPAEMVPETEVARLHAQLHALAPPDRARALARDAGLRTGDYILANRIPAPARTLLRLLPAAPAAALLVRAIAAHAWTFAGSGQFSYTPGRPLVVAIGANPLARPGVDAPACVWHTAVFERLFQRLVTRNAQVREVECCGTGAPACTFEIAW